MTIYSIFPVTVIPCKQEKIANNSFKMYRLHVYSWLVF